MNHNLEYRVLILDQDERSWPIYNDILGDENIEIDVASSLDGVEDQDYNTVVTDYIGEETHEVWETWDDVIMYTANDYEVLDIPEGVEYIQKGHGFGELRDKVNERIQNYEVPKQ